ncbi:hypothetical protein SAMN04489735_103813 [Aneurinibacillus thermoaerophilus]|uniref:Uncharacterized protein n=1 Tax=Aneurinibacillus thermoaerophilus TaxID=143495 RepID=A0A1G8DZU9_ANETH|nr:hypothetical protein SAMN04489735_103813 [Aneurinibacillus thermoaerophilus]
MEKRGQLTYLKFANVDNFLFLGLKIRLLLLEFDKSLGK